MCQNCFLAYACARVHSKHTHSQKKAVVYWKKLFFFLARKHTHKSTPTHTHTYNIFRFLLHFVAKLNLLKRFHSTGLKRWRKIYGKSAILSTFILQFAVKWTLRTTVRRAVNACWMLACWQWYRLVCFHEHFSEHKPKCLVSKSCFRSKIDSYFARVMKLRLKFVMAFPFLFSLFQKCEISECLLFYNF